VIDTSPSRAYLASCLRHFAKGLEKGKVILLNLSCLVAKGKVDSLGEELEKIDNMEGFSVRFTGPWPPYSFVAKPSVANSNTG